MVIKLTNVSKVIKKAKVLDNVNLELTSGKVYGLKGKNGSGKTMLMRVICGLISATEGTVEKVHDILEEQKKRGAVIIIACHDKEELDQLSDEIIEISDGRIINKTC